MAYDRDEWRTPWRAEGRPDPRAATPTGDVGRGSDEAHQVGATSMVGADTEVTDGPAPGEQTATAWSAPSPEPASTSEPASASEPASSSEPGAGPITRFPQPPPSSWGADAVGPGSPNGSVRPPDTTGTHDAPPRKAGGRSWSIAIVGGLIGALVGGGMVTALSGTDDGGSTTTAPTIDVDGEASSIVPAVAEAVTPSVVRIDVGSDAANPLGGGSSALGSGVIYRSDGYILTNNHVVAEAETVDVRLASGDVLAAEVVGTDPLNDLAVIQVERDGLPAINVRDEGTPLVVGEMVVAIGSPFGLDASVTSGIISGLNRDLQVPDEGRQVTSIPAVIQTDAAINPGNSGGALVDAEGNLVGINTAILSRTGGNQGIGFAVPVEQAVESADQIIEQGFVRHPLLGITGIDVSPEIAQEFGLEASRGAVVDAVQPGTGAADADIQPGDIITAVDGEPLATMAELVAEVRRRAPGDRVELTIVRGGDELTVDVTLSERPR